MHVISRPMLENFWLRHPDAEGQLKAWYHEAKNAAWGNSAELKERYPLASIINRERVVFDICGKKYRLVVRINYISEVVFIRWIGTHAEYDRVDVENV